MTLNYERKYSLKETKNFLEAVANPSSTPRVPKEIRRWAINCLRHYPHDHEIEQMSKKMPKLLGENLEDNYK